MLRFVLLLVFSVFFVQQSASAFTLVADSVGQERKNGKLFLLHKVEPKETLYALSRKYNVTVAQIVEANPKIESTIAIGQLVYIPRKSTSAPVARPAAAAGYRTYTVDQRGAKIHKVEPKQTLYSISKMYNVSQEDLKKWNNLKTDQVKIGESLVVGYGSKTTKNPLYVPEPDDEVELVKVSETTKPAAEQPKMSEATAKRVDAPETARKEEAKAVAEAAEDRAINKGSVAATSKIVENGLAEAIDQKVDTNKFLALHKTAPVGTILQVKNIMNNQTVYVRVIGKLPATGDNEKVVVKLSKRAYQRLGALDNRFRVEVSYMP
ncbi:MAG: LysM peptidoglycan-binding domain-containing protein [Hymenobacteraceae bacterium]|nr:LysM peptidoglycan-binding domain-containing protein [Hymenobacteraceae bacterium]